MRRLVNIVLVVAGLLAFAQLTRIALTPQGPHAPQYFPARAN